MGAPKRGSMLSADAAARWASPRPWDRWATVLTARWRRASSPPSNANSSTGAYSVPRLRPHGDLRQPRQAACLSDGIPVHFQHSALAETNQTLKLSVRGQRDIDEAPLYVLSTYYRAASQARQRVMAGQYLVRHDGSCRHVSTWSPPHDPVLMRAQHRPSRAGAATTQKHPRRSCLSKGTGTYLKRQSFSIC